MFFEALLKKSVVGVLSIIGYLPAVVSELAVILFGPDEVERGHAEVGDAELLIVGQELSSTLLKVSV